MAHDVLDILETDIRAADRQESGLKDFRLLGKLWPYMRSYRRPLFLGILLLPLITVSDMSMTFLVRAALDGPIRAGHWQGLALYAAGFLGLLGLHYGFRYRQLLISQETGQRIILDLRTDLYRHFQALPPSFYQAHPLGKLVTRITSDIENLSEMLSSGGFAILADIAVIAGAILGMLIMEWHLGLLTLVSLAILIALMSYARSQARAAYDEMRIKIARMNAFLQENIAGMEIVQLYRRQTRNYQHFEALNASNLASGLRSIFYSTGFNALVEFMTTLTLIIVLWYSGQRILQHAMTFGLMVAFFQFVMKMFEPIEDLSEKYATLQSGLSSIDKIMALLNEPLPPGHSAETPEAEKFREQQKAGGNQAFERPTGAITFKDVRFGYIPDHRVLKDVSFQVAAGETIAVVGPSGAGKTTLMKLLLRFYTPDHGQILLDARDIRDWPLAALRRAVVSIQQDDFLFSRSVAENIALAPYHPAMEAALRRAAEAANAWRVITRMPQGLMSVLEERGKNLSAGEKQLILFARAFYHAPAVLILDEATSAIDPMTEVLVQEGLTRLMQGRTVLIVAHRLSTIQKAHRILVMRDGQLIEQGSHTELISRPDGVYAQFCQYQQALAMP